MPGCCRDDLCQLKTVLEGVDDTRAFDCGGLIQVVDAEVELEDLVSTGPRDLMSVSKEGRKEDTGWLAPKTVTFTI